MWQEMIKINNLDKYYFKGKRNELHVINKTSLELPSLGLISILGPSGSGKTTLLNVIGGLDKARGDISYDERVIHNSNMHKIDSYRKENIGYIFQNYNLLQEETVSDNLKIALEMVGVVDKEEVEKRIEYTLKSVGMFKYRKKQAYALSGGQQQRVAIARALVKNAKIIIADEPTGNLDSENTLEVMNILKKISKNTLVLLVTHDVKIAKFYSNYIVELKDGVIQSFQKQEDENSLSTNLSNRVYLKDLNYVEEQNSFGNTKIYFDGETIKPFDLDIIIRNGNIYLKSDQPLKLVESSNLKLINDHYKDLDSKALEDISYDTSWFSKKKHRFKDKFISIAKQFKKAFLSFRKVNKRSKVLYFAFCCIGVLLGASIICTINFATTDTSGYFYADQEYRMISPEHTFQEDPIYKIRQNYELENLMKPSILEEEDYIIFSLNLTYQKQVRLKLNSLVLRLNEKDIHLKYGRFPQDNYEVIIDETNAKLMSNEYGVGSPIDTVLGDSIELHSKDGSIIPVKVVGICDSAQKTVYTTDYVYTNWVNYKAQNLFGDFRYIVNEVDSHGDPVYEITSGRAPVVPDPNHLGIRIEKEVLVHESYRYYANRTHAYYNGIAYKIVGTYRFKESAFNSRIEECLINNPIESMWRFSSSMAFEENEYVIQDGRKPQGFNECIASVYSGVKIGAKIDNKEVVGIYTGSGRAISAKSIVSLDAYILTDCSYDKIGFSVNDLDQFDCNSDQKIISLFEYCNQLSKENQVSNLRIFELLSFILMIISAIFIYLIMRSKMISDIYSIGVYRCLGAPRIKIIGKSLVDLIILSTFTTLIGYIVVLLVYNISAKYINQLIGDTMLRINNLLFVLGLIGIYILNLIIGIIPICLLLRKTPAEICSKYDI